MAIAHPTRDSGEPKPPDIVSIPFHACRPTHALRESLGSTESRPAGERTTSQPATISTDTGRLKLCARRLAQRCRPTCGAPGIIAPRSIPPAARRRDKSLAHSKLLHQIPFVNVGQIKQRLENGFKPFEIQLSNGRRIRVPHPDFIAVGKRTIAVIGENDLVSVIDALHIVSIDDVPAKRRGR